MKRITPKFLNSPYFVGEPGNWHLTQGAPEDIVMEFSEYTNNKMALREIPTIIELDSNEIAQLKAEILKVN
jgi:hypothetical protein